MSEEIIGGIPLSHEEIRERENQEAKIKKDEETKAKKIAWRIILGFITALVVLWGYSQNAFLLAVTIMCSGFVVGFILWILHLSISKKVDGDLEANLIMIPSIVGIIASIPLAIFLNYIDIVVGNICKKIFSYVHLCMYDFFCFKFSILMSVFLVAKS